MNELATLTLSREGTIAIAAVSGEVDFSNAEDLGLRIVRWITNEDAAFVLDFCKLSYADSTGINLVFDLAARLREHGTEFAVVLPMESQPWRTFSMVGLETQVPIHETLEDAMAGMAQGE